MHKKVETNFIRKKKIQRKKAYFNNSQVTNDLY